MNNNENRCDQCQYWIDRKRRYGGTDKGCSRIIREFDVDVSAGWEGACVNWIETSADFSCKFFEKIP